MNQDITELTFMASGFTTFMPCLDNSYIHPYDKTSASSECEMLQSLDKLSDARSVEITIKTNSKCKSTHSV